jgi:7-cyano-7-deazaguanine synthase
MASVVVESKPPDKRITALDIREIAFFFPEHRTMRISLSDIGGSALTDSAIEVPKFKPSDEIPVTYVPARNTIFLSYAMA